MALGGASLPVPGYCCLVGGDAKIWDEPVRSCGNLAVDPRIMMSFVDIASDQEAYRATDEEIGYPVLLGTQPGRCDNRSQPVGSVRHPPMLAPVFIGKHR